MPYGHSEATLSQQFSKVVTLRWPAPPLQYTKIEVRISQGQLHSPKDPPSVYHTRGLNRAGGTIETRKSRKNETSSEQ